MHCKTVHVIGICGIGMSAIAKHFYALGYNVEGSDACKKTEIAKTLESIGIKIFHNHSSGNVINADLIIKSNAIPKSNVELLEAKKLNKEILTRQHALQKILEGKNVIAISGCHGKTTTTAMVAAIFMEAGLQPNVICGGIMNNCNDNACISKSDLFIVEADESDDTFINIPSNLAVVTNIGADHLDFHHSLEEIYKKFIKFVQKSKLAIIPEDKKIKEFCSNYKIYNCNNIKDIKIQGWKTYFKYKIKGNFYEFELSVIGKHNIENAVAAISAAVEYGIDFKHIASALKNFSGVKRRLSKVGDFKNNLVLEDYAHHPVEILSAINAVKQVNANLVAVVQPHRYTRVKNFFNDYIKVLNIAKYTILLPVYGAEEGDKMRFNSFVLYNKLKELNCKNVYLACNFEELYLKIIEINLSNGVVLFMGAGDVDVFARNLIIKNIKT